MGGELVTLWGCVIHGFDILRAVKLASFPGSPRKKGVLQATTAVRRPGNEATVKLLHVNFGGYWLQGVWKLCGRGGR